jgi:hypothetical protein
MKKTLLLLLTFLFTQSLVATPSRFFDPNSGISFEVPEEFFLDMEESILDSENSLWFYTFVNLEGDQLSIEIESYDHMLTLFEFFHSTMIDGFEEDDQLVADSFHFQHLFLNDLELTSCQFRLLSIDGEEVDPLYVCDYLFVKDNLGISVNLLKEGDENTKFEDMHQLIETIIETIELDVAL